MTFIAVIFGLIGFVFALITYSRIDKLEKHLRERGIVDRDFKSEEEIS